MKRFAGVILVGVVGWSLAACTAEGMLVNTGSRTVADGETVDNIIVTSGSVTVESGGKVRQGILLASGNVTIDEGGSVGGGILATSGTVTINGEVKGDVFAFSGNVEVGPTARVAGNIGTASGSLDVDPDADVTGEVTENTPLPRGIPQPGLTLRPPGPGGSFLWLMFRALLPALIAAVIAAVAPLRVERMATSAQASPGPAWAFGCLGWIAVVALAITLCLLPVALVLAFVFVLASVLGWVGLGAWLGRRLLPDKSPIMAASVGTFALSLLVGVLGLAPCCGGIFELIADSLALGVVLVTRAGGRYYPPGAAPFVETGSTELAPPAG